MKSTRLTVNQDPEQPIERSVLAQSIVDISKSFQKLSSSGLNEKAIVCLVHEFSGVGKPDIRAVISALKQLEKEYTK